MKTKTFILLLVLCASAIGARAGDGVWVERIDGTKQGFLFSDYPVITDTAENLVMTSTTATVEFPIVDIRNVYFADDISTGIRDVARPAVQDPLIRVTSDGAQLSGFAPRTAVSIYDVGGQLLSREQTSADGTLTVSLSARPQGIYIIKTNQTTLKIQKR